MQESGVLGASEPASPQTAAKLRHLLDETADLIESPSFGYVVTLLNNEGFSTLIESKCAHDAFKSSSHPPSLSSSKPEAIPEAPEEPSTKLANVLAVMARQAHVIGNGANPPNDYLVAMDQGVRELDAFAAVVYSSNFDNELLSFGSGGMVPGSRLPVAEDSMDPYSSYETILVDRDGDDGGAGASDRMVQSLTSTDMLSSWISPTAPAAAEGEGEKEQGADDSALERAWGKAVDDDKQKESPTQ